MAQRIDTGNMAVVNPQFTGASPGALRGRTFSLPGQGMQPFQVGPAPVMRPTYVNPYVGGRGTWGGGYPYYGPQFGYGYGGGIMPAPSYGGGAWGRMFGGTMGGFRPSPYMGGQYNTRYGTMTMPGGLRGPNMTRGGNVYYPGPDEYPPYTPMPASTPPVQGSMAPPSYTTATPATPVPTPASTPAPMPAAPVPATPAPAPYNPPAATGPNMAMAGQPYNTALPPSDIYKGPGYGYGNAGNSGNPMVWGAAGHPSSAPTPISAPPGTEDALAAYFDQYYPGWRTTPGGINANPVNRTPGTDINTPTYSPMVDWASLEADLFRR